MKLRQTQLLIIIYYCSLHWGAGGGFVLVGAVGFVWFILWKSRKRGENIDESPMANMDLIDNDFGKQIGPRKFSYNKLARATSNFVEREELGEGGFGGVYKGFIKDLNSYVAVKRISKGSRQGLKEYASELS
ncbi:L-type lectin-domain containing receptor kinase IX.1-like [Pyrus ussuriensis x Pyrus communis]|uniref:L-type lectin-domain containing receptor kinase IX.1-like n=1 Tax=Pyrus ussuriensis x Pyrus communis TaxID=2448454 RepID=A0A5N5GMA9_9ROSA|nr:L-type lectin-domain containing receptor kinase IX.1-like [Pyrus ussuriensis x Pyrus communis]